MDLFQCLVIFIIKTVSPNFTPHIDLQKLGEIILKGEKYNILKPTVHKVTEHFEDEKLRRDTRDSERVFIDDYGFRHFWKGFDNRKRYNETDNGVINYRRDEEIVDSVNENVEDGKPAIRPKPATKRGPKRAAKPAATKNAKKPAVAKITKKPAAIKNAKKPTVTKNSKKLFVAKNATNPAAANKATNPAAANKTKNPAATKNGKKAVATKNAKKPVAANKTTKPAVAKKAKPTGKPGPVAGEKMQLKLRTGANNTATGGPERTIAKTYFFCPFFGVIAMKGFID